MSTHFYAKDQAAVICEGEGLDQRLPDLESDGCPQCRTSVAWDRQSSHKVLCFRPSPLCFLFGEKVLARPNRSIFKSHVTLTSLKHSHTNQLSRRPLILPVQMSP